MRGRVSPVLFFAVIGVVLLASGFLLYQAATEPLYRHGVPLSPAESGQPFSYIRLTRAMPAGTTTAAPFVDVAAAAGLRYEWSIPGKRPLNILQTIGKGCAFLDHDEDGNLDILLVGPSLALYRGDGHGHFTDVSHETGLDQLHGRFLGCAVGDYDNDGYPDLYISGYRTGLLLHNEPVGSRQPAVGTQRSTDPAIENRKLKIENPRVFRDVTKKAGLIPQPWGTSCAFVETTPGSGRLDLYVCNYVDFDPDVGPDLCKEGHATSACRPLTYRPLKGVLYRNDGRGHFTDDTVASGASAVSGNGLGVAAADYDGSGWPSLAIANDMRPGDLLHPAARAGGGPAYQNVGVRSGTAYDPNGGVHAGMGIDWGDFDNDGSLDLFVTTFSNEAKSLYHNDGRGAFTDATLRTGVAAATLPYVAFGCKFLDYDNDGWLDIMIANGHVWSNADEVVQSRTYRQPTQLFHNLGAGKQEFEDVSRSSPDLLRPIVGRGLAVGDFDNDGGEDALIVDAEGKPLLLHNQTRPAGHWLGVNLSGVKSNRDGYGALLTVKAGGRTLLRQCQTCGSYLSASDRRVHFGLGNAARADVLTVRWPSGRMAHYRNLPADRYITLQEGTQSL